MNRFCFEQERQMLTEEMLQGLCDAIDVLADCAKVVKTSLKGEDYKDEESRKEGARPLIVPDGYDKEIHCVISYTPGVGPDVMYSSECDEMLLADPEKYACVPIPETPVSVLYNKEASIHIDGKVISTERVLFLIMDDEGNYSEIDKDAFSLIMEYLIDSQAQIICYGDLIPAIGVPNGRRA